MEGLEAVVLSSKEFNSDNFDFRLDSEYFLKSNLFFIKELDNTGFKRIGEFSYVTDGIHTSIDYSETSNINLISATSPRENYFDISRKAYITEEAHLNNPRTALKENDIIISTVGTIGNCAVVTKNILPANSDRHVGIVRVNKDFWPNYVSTFLITKYGRFQTWRESTGNVQLNLFLYKIRTLKIANLTNAFQVEIDSLVKLSHNKRELSNQTYKTAESLLLETLGLSNFAPSAEPVNVKGFKESFLTTGRLDAEYYQKKYEEIEKQLRKKDVIRLKDVFKLLSNPSPSNYLESGTKVIKTKNIRIPSVEIENITDHTNAKCLLVEKNDLLFASMGVGSLGRVSYIEREIENCTIDGTIKILRCKKEYQNRNLEVPTLLFLTSSFGQELIYKHVIGSTGIISISKENVENLTIPMVDKLIADNLTSMVLDSQNLKKQSEQLLETAKRAVEIAIEQDEEAAIDYIQNTNS